MKKEKSMKTTQANMKTMSVLDWLLHKPVDVTFPVEKKLSPGDLVVYKDSEKKEYLGEYLGYTTKTEKSGKYIRTLAGRELERFEQNKGKAQDLFELFKKDFKDAFPTAKPITSRINLYGNQIYFYFYAEQRYDFSSFVRSFREKIPMRFFIYQVGARDRIRLHPNRDEWYDANGLPLMYHIFKHPLDQVNNDVVMQQGLRGRDMERLKDWSGKLDHTLAFEMDIYNEEIPKYPEKGVIFLYEGKKMRCNGFNILTQEIKLRGEDTEKKGIFTGEYLTISLEEYEKHAKKIERRKPSSSREQKRKQRQVKGGQK